MYVRQSTIKYFLNYRIKKLIYVVMRDTFYYITLNHFIIKISKYKKKKKELKGFLYLNFICLCSYKVCFLYAGQFYECIFKFEWLSFSIFNDYFSILQ